MSGERDPIDVLLEQIADGNPVDWESAVRTSPTVDRVRLERLREVERIAAFNRDLFRDAGEVLESGGAVLAPKGAIDAAPERWGELILLERLGSGATADVYRAWDSKLQRDVALKLFRAEASSSTAASRDAALLEEGRAAARVRHPNVVAVHGIDRRDGRVGLWMEWVRGPSLERLVASRGPLSPTETTQLGLEIGAALAAVHASGLLHRDVKPANLLRDSEGRFVLVDFGLGVRGDDALGSRSRPAGTPLYMAPEVLAGEPATPSSDLYSLSLTLEFAKTGRLPFDVRTMEELLAAAARGPAARPEARFASARDFIEHLGRENAPAKAAPAPAAPSHRTAFGLVALVGALAIAAFFVARMNSNSKERAAVDIATTAPAPTLAPVAGVPDPAAYQVGATLVRHADGGRVPLRTGDPVAPGDRLSLEVEASRPLYLYVLNEDERGERYLLFPQPAFDQKNPLPADTSLTLPGSIAGRANAWTVTSRGGREHFLVVASPEPVAELEADLAKIPAPRPNQPIAYAAVASASFERLRGAGGLSEIPASPPSEASAPSAFERFRALAEREKDVSGVWVRAVVLENPLPAR